MIELILVFLLGALASGLLILLFLPALWGRAVRLSTRRLEMQLPLSMKEIIAERDQLRAEFAATQRRLEQKLTAVDADYALARGSLGQDLAKLVQAETAGAELRKQLNGLEQDLQMQTRLRQEAEARIEAMTIAMNEAATLALRKDQDIQDLTSNLNQLKQTHQSEVAALKVAEDHAQTLVRTIVELEDRVKAGAELGDDQDSASNRQTLRQSISTLGKDILGLTRQLEAEQGGTAKAAEHLIALRSRAERATGSHQAK